MTAPERRAAEEPAWTYAIDYAPNPEGVMVEVTSTRVAVVTEAQWNAALARAVREEREKIPLLEWADDGTPLYVHAKNCSSFCDYACNGPRGFRMIEQLGARHHGSEG